MTTTPGSRQQNIPGTEPSNPRVADAIERWLERLERKKQAAELEAEADDAVVIAMVEEGVAYYPYTDPDTGKRKYRVVDTTPRGKSISARPADPVVVPDEPEVSESVEPPKPEQVTHRKVSRKAAAKDIAAEASARSKRTNGEAADVGEFRPARSYDDDEATHG